jgi:1-deoxy-D-xylulose-5-phosphate reductoisomerase
MRTVSLVGSTGSIGIQAAEVMAAEPDRYRVVALAARRSVERLAAQARQLRPDRVAVVDPAAATELERLVPPGTEVWAGPDALAAVATDADVVLNAVVGFAGLAVTMSALRAGTRLALANKESLIAGGPVVQRVRSTPGAELVPVDSEHSAVHQCLAAVGSTPGAGGGDDGAHGVPPAERVARIVLTASGGPFRGRSPAELATVTVEDALRHPTWRMGAKITVDSSTLMNKGLEVIEAHELFGLDSGRIAVVVHPQSVVHSMVELVDGATFAQLSSPDMRLPISYALAYPDRGRVPFGRLDWTKAMELQFEPPDPGAFPCLRLGYEAGRAGGTAPAWLNAANEVAVTAFLDGLIPWGAIADVIEETLAAHEGTEPDSVDVVIEADRRARERARRAVERRAAAA